MPARVPAALEGRDVHVEALAGPDAMQLRIWGRREDIDEGLRVASALFDRPEVTAATLASTMHQGSEQIQARSSMPAGMVADAIADVIFPPDEARARPMAREQGEKVTVGAAQQWLEKHIATAPVEVSIVGDLSLDEAMRLGAGYLGRLPARERPSPKTFADARRLPPPVYPIRAEVIRSIDPGSAIVVVGFPGADAANIPDLRTMRVAARVLDDRATAALRASGFDEAEVGTAAIPGTVYPGFGVVVANFKTTAARADEAADVIEGVITKMAAEGVSAGEVKAAGEELSRAVERFEKEPRYWMGILARAESSGVDPNLVADGSNFYRSVNADTVSAAVKRNVGEGRILRLTIHAAPPGAEGDVPAGRPAAK
jgi:zinc protease